MMIYKRRNRFQLLSKKTGTCLIVLFLMVISMSSVFAVSQDDELITPVIQLLFSEEDSIKYVTAVAKDYTSDTAGIPVSELDIYLYVKRSFSLLAIGEYYNTTDENGEVTIEFPGDLPGDSDGNVIIIARIDEDHRYNETEVSEIVNFGIPVQIDLESNKRSLAAAGANAPLSLLLLVNGIILAVWGVIIYIIIQIFKISRVK